MKAVVITDQYEDQSIKEGLYKELSVCGVLPLEFPSLDALKERFMTLEPSEPHMFFPNIYLKTNIPYIIELCKSKFPIIVHGQWVVSFIPEFTEVTRDSVTCMEEEYGKRAFSVFSLPEFKKPILSSLPRVIIYTHNREIYFRLTMNSIMNALTFCPEIPVTIVLNAPTKPVEDVAMEFQWRYPQVDILKCLDNLAFAGMNVGIQWHNPDVIIGAEDDFVLPAASKYLYPVWPYQFALRAEHFFRLGWGLDLENIAFDTQQSWRDPKTETRLGWHTASGFDKSKKENVPLACQLWAFKKKNWVQSYDLTWKTAVDCHFNKFSLLRTMPFLKGYHLSWNADNLYSIELQNKARKIQEEATVTSLRTNETRKIVMDDVLK